MTDAEIETAYNEALEGRHSLVFDGLKAVAIAAAKKEREACAKIANEKASSVMKQNSYRGKVSSPASFAISMLEDVGLSIRSRTTELNKITPALHEL